MKISREVKVALYGLLVLFAAYWGINFLKGLDIFSQSNTYKALYTESDNIEISSPVLIRGVKVGSVTAIRLNDINQNIELEFTIKKKYLIPSNSIAIIANKSMLSGKAVIIKTGDSTTHLEDDDFIEGKLDDNVTKQIDEFKDQLYGSLTAIKETLDNVNKILNEEAIKDITSTVSNINSITEDAAKVMKTSSARIAAITLNIEKITKDFSEMTPSLKTTISNVSVITDSLKTSLPALTVSVTNTINDVNATIASINDKKGTLGLLINDNSLYKNLDTSSANLSTLLYDLKENPSRYVRVSVFGSKDPLTKQKEKEQKREIREQKRNSR